MDAHSAANDGRIFEFSDCRELTKAISAIVECPEQAWRIMDHCLLASREPHGKVLGVTGPEFVGKSTLINALITAFRRHGYAIAVLAIDPTSHISGGAMLGDRIRMRDHWLDQGVFIRSIATRSATGGIAHGLPHILDLMQRLADVVIVETAGSGQTDADIAALCHTLLVIPATTGDEISVMKSGAKEYAHVLAVNIREDDARAERFAHALRGEWEGGALPDGWQRKVYAVDALSGKGVDELVTDGILAHWIYLEATACADTATSATSSEQPVKTDQPNTSKKTNQ